MAVFTMTISEETMAFWEKTVGYTDKREGITYITTSPPSPLMIDVLYEQGFYKSKSDARRAMQQGGVQYRKDETERLMTLSEKSQCTDGLYRIGKHQGMEVCKDGTIRAICIKDYPQKPHGKS